ncbi:hypothetical protein IQ06DRAFT_336487 [Phaeosphaeriaceae sp. SRC1lsM3a]|nr:hypothetical protein IQ06DRAFT_336487 [Stagonospora sp. SRC1lsM3a]
MSWKPSEAATSQNVTTVVDQSNYGMGIFLSSSSFRATDPRDYVYGLLGIANIGLPIDYSFSTGMVYQSLIELWMADSAAHTTLAEAGDPLWFLTHAGIGQLWDRLESTPSWVPNFAGVSRHGHNIHSAYSRSIGNRSAQLLAGNQGHFGKTDPVSISGSILVCPLLLIDRVIDRGVVLPPYDVEYDQFVLDILCDLRQWILQYLQETDVYPGNCHPVSAIVSALFSKEEEPLSVLDWFPFVQLMTNLLAEFDPNSFDQVALLDLTIKELRIENVTNKPASSRSQRTAHPNRAGL